MAWRAGRRSVIGRYSHNWNVNQVFFYFTQFLNCKKKEIINVKLLKLVHFVFKTTVSICYISNYHSKNEMERRKMIIFFSCVAFSLLFFVFSCLVWHSLNSFGACTLSLCQVNWKNVEWNAFQWISWPGDHNLFFFYPTATKCLNMRNRKKENTFACFWFYWKKNDVLNA